MTVHLKACAVGCSCLSACLCVRRCRSVGVVRWLVLFALPVRVVCRPSVPGLLGGGALGSCSGGSGCAASGLGAAWGLRGGRVWCPQGPAIFITRYLPFSAWPVCLHRFFPLRRSVFLCRLYSQNRSCLASQLSFAGRVAYFSIFPTRPCDAGQFLSDERCRDRHQPHTSVHGSSRVLEVGVPDGSPWTVKVCVCLSLYIYGLYYIYNIDYIYI